MVDGPRARVRNGILGPLRLLQLMANEHSRSELFKVVRSIRCTYFGPNILRNQDVIACIVDGLDFQLIIQEGALQQAGLYMTLPNHPLTWQR